MDSVIHFSNNRGLVEKANFDTDSFSTTNTNYLGYTSVDDRTNSNAIYNSESYSSGITNNDVTSRQKNCGRDPRSLTFRLFTKLLKYSKLLFPVADDKLGIFLERALLCPLNLLFRYIAVAVMVFLNSLLTFGRNVDRGGKEERKLCRYRMLIVIPTSPTLHVSQLQTWRICKRLRVKCCCRRGLS